MTEQAELGSIWARYLGGTVVHLVEVFPIPTIRMPDMRKALLARGDVAEVWYLAPYELGQEFDRRKAAQVYPHD